MFPFKTLEEKFRSIPDDVREAISSTEVNEKLQEIVNKYELQLDEGEELTKEIGYVMLGLKNPDYFVRNVQNATALDKATAEKIVADVNKTIFKGIKDSLREIHNKKIAVEEIEPDDLNEEIQAKMRDELLQEIEKPKEVGTDLMELPEQELQVIPQPTGSEQIKTNPSQPITPTTTKKDEQTLEKKYIIDPYREPLS